MDEINLPGPKNSKENTQMEVQKLKQLTPLENSRAGEWSIGDGEVEGVRPEGRRS